VEEEDIEEDNKVLAIMRIKAIIRTHLRRLRPLGSNI